MNTETKGVLIIVSIGILAIFILTQIEKIKRKSYQKGWNEGRKDIANRLSGSTFWIKENPMLTNFLWIVSNYIKEFDNLDIDNVRNKIQNLGNTKVHDLPIDERKEYFPKNQSK